MTKPTQQEASATSTTFVARVVRMLTCFLLAAALSLLSPATWTFAAEKANTAKTSSTSKSSSTTKTTSTSKSSSTTKTTSTSKSSKTSNTSNTSKTSSTTKSTKSSKTSNTTKTTKAAKTPKTSKASKTSSTSKSSKTSKTSKTTSNTTSNTSRSQTTPQVKDTKKAALRAQPWAFGGGKSAKTWANQGVAGSSLQQNATAYRPDSRKDQDTLTTSSDQNGVSSLLDRDGFKVSVDEERQGWEVSPSRATRPDEDTTTDSQHRVRAFATHQDDNLSIGLGPEFIVKDSNDTSTVFKKNHDQPELDAGLGMQFKLDF